VTKTATTGLTGQS